jgi:isoquinoline 1-oxidoreductase beta subunit
VDLPAKVDGSQLYAVDIQLPGLLHAAIHQCPVFGGKVKSVDDSKARNMPGVRKIVTSDDWVAVVAGNWWQAHKAVQALKIEWDGGANTAVNSDSIMRKLKQDLAADKAPIARKDGDTAKAFASAHKVLEAEYFTGFVNHATMEPQNATALYKPDELQVLGRKTAKPRSMRRPRPRGCPWPRSKCTRCMQAVPSDAVSCTRTTRSKR